MNGVYTLNPSKKYFYKGKTLSNAYQVYYYNVINFM